MRNIQNRAFFLGFCKYAMEKEADLYDIVRDLGRSFRGIPRDSKTQAIKAQKTLRDFFGYPTQGSWWDKGDARKGGLSGEAGRGLVPTPNVQGSQKAPQGAKIKMPPSYKGPGNFFDPSGGY